MNLLFIILGTIVISCTLEISNEMSIFKDVASRGYKIDMNKVSKHIDKKQNKLFWIKLLIPGVNIISSIKRMIKYDKIKKELFQKIDETDLFVKMTEEELEKYSDSPKSTTALNMAIPLEEKKEIKEPKKPQGYICISNGTYRHEYNDGTYTKIKFRREKDKVVVTSLEGKILELSPKEQQKELNRTFNTLYKLNAVIEEPSQITLQKEALIAHRDEILSNQDEMKLTLK